MMLTRFWLCPKRVGIVLLIEIFRQAVIQNHRVLRFDMYTLFLQERSRTLVCTVVTAAFFKSRTTQKVTYRIAGGRFPDNEHKGSWFNSAGNQVVRFDFGHERIKLGHIGEQIELLFQYFFQPHQCQQTRFHILLIECALLYLVVGNLSYQIESYQPSCVDYTGARQCLSGSGTQQGRGSPLVKMSA